MKLCIVIEKLRIKYRLKLPIIFSLAVCGLWFNLVIAESQHETETPRSTTEPIATGVPPMPKLLVGRAPEQGVLLPLYLRTDRSGWDIVGRVFQEKYYMINHPPKDGAGHYCRYYDEACVIDLELETYLDLWKHHLPAAIEDLQQRTRVRDEVAFHKRIMREDAQQQYWYQYTAVETASGKQKIELLGLCRDQFSWAELAKPTAVMDGGDCILNGIFDLETKTFDWFEANGEA